MIAKAKSISHGIIDLNYITGVSANKKHPEKIFHICDNNLPPGLDPLGIWNSMKLTSMSHPRLTNNLIRIEISPAAEYTKDFTPEHWKQLWLDFAEEFDRQEIKDKNGRTLSPRTNITGSKSTVWLHEESGSGIPHLHAAVCRVDEAGNTNNDCNIHLRAQRAAERIARKRGWQTAANIREVSKKQVGKDCLDVLRRMDKWSVESYFAGLRAKGYDVKTRTDEAGILRGYVLRKGNSKFKASEIGKGRNLMASKLEGTWKKLHDSVEQHTHDDYYHNDYTVYRSGTQRTEIEHDGISYTRYIPEPVMKVFDDSFYYRETENWPDLINEACYHFAVAMIPPDNDYIKWTVGKAMYMADGTALKQKQALDENGFYSDIISSSAVCTIMCDSINFDEHERKFTYYGTQLIKRRTRDLKRSMVTTGYIETVPRTQNNPHGLMITGWRTIENKDLDY